MYVHVCVYIDKHIYLSVHVLQLLTVSTAFRLIDV